MNKRDSIDHPTLMVLNVVMAGLLLVRAFGFEMALIFACAAAIVMFVILIKITIGDLTGS